MEKEIIEAKRELLDLKTSQSTRNDSFLTYVYYSDNLYGRTWSSISMEFIPYTKNIENVICDFTVSSGQAMQYNEQGNIQYSSTSCLRATYVGSNDVWKSGLPNMSKFCYIICQTNCRGELKITLN